MTWQPIETAPKDGTAVLLYLPRYARLSTLPMSSMTTARWQNEQWWLCETGGYAEDADVHPQPTHWMLLPEPPDA